MSTRVRCCLHNWSRSSSQIDASMNLDRELLERRITGILCKAIGQRLRSVVCTGIEGDLAAEVISDPEFDTVGGILLGFDDAKAFVSWDQNAGWSDQMTIGV